MASKANISDKSDKTKKAAPKPQMKTITKAPQKATQPAPVKGSGPVINSQNITAGMPKLEEGPAAATMSLKNYRTNPDMENFFRFIYDNDLRAEALHIIDEILEERKNRKKKIPTQA